MFLLTYDIDATRGGRCCSDLHIAELLTKNPGGSLHALLVDAFHVERSLRQVCEKIQNLTSSVTGEVVREDLTPQHA